MQTTGSKSERESSKPSSSLTSSKSKTSKITPPRERSSTVTSTNSIDPFLVEVLHKYVVTTANETYDTPGATATPFQPFLP